MEAGNSGQKVSLPLTAVDRASGLALCVNAFARRAHLQLSARGGGRLQSIGRSGRRRGGSGHGWGVECGGRAPWAWIRLMVVGK